MSLVTLPSELATVTETAVALAPTPTAGSSSEALLAPTGTPLVLQR